MIGLAKEIEDDNLVDWINQDEDQNPQSNLRRVVNALVLIDLVITGK